MQPLEVWAARSRKPAKAKRDRDAEWLRSWCDGDWLTRYAVRRLRRIAKRLEGKS